MMRKLSLFFLPHEDNNYHPHALRHDALTSYLIIFLCAQLIPNLFFSSRQQVLGFATSIYQNEIISLTNKERVARGFSTLAENEKLDQAALDKAQNMFQDGYWAHISPTGTTPWHWFEKENYNYYMAGENLARDFNTSAGVVNAWMNSPSHKENLLNGQFSEIGVAVVNGRLLGEETTLVVQFFGRPEGSTTLLGEAVVPSSSITGQATQVVPLTVSSSTPSRENEPRIFLTNMLSPQSWGWGQKIGIFMLGLIALLFAFDTLVLYRKKMLHLRSGSHSFLHFLTIVILVLGIMASGGGLLI